MNMTGPIRSAMTTGYGSINNIGRIEQNEKKITVEIHNKKSANAPRITVRKTSQPDYRWNTTSMLKRRESQASCEKESQSDVFVYGPPVVHWVQTMREKLAKAKTAGFDHQGAFLQRKTTAKT